MTSDILFKGRMNRRNFILTQVTLMIVAFTVIAFVLGGDFTFQALIDKNKELTTSLLILAPIGLAFQFICSFRRLHDINQSGLWSFALLASLMLIPFVDMILLVFLSYKKGDVGENKYGNPDKRTLLDSLLNK